MDFWGILEYTVAVTVIGLFIWLVKLIFHDKLDARWHYFIWLVLLVRLLVPFRFGLISTPISVFQDIPLETWIEMGRILAEKGDMGKLSLDWENSGCWELCCWEAFTWPCGRFCGYGLQERRKRTRM